MPDIDPEQLEEAKAQAQAVAEAGKDAAAGGETPAEKKELAEGAIREAASEKGMDLSDGQIEALATGLASPLADELMERFAAMDVFSAPPASQQPAGTAEEAAEAEAEASDEGEPVAPRKRTFAERWEGRR